MYAKTLVQQTGLRALGAALLIGAAGGIIALAGCASDARPPHGPTVQAPVLLSGQTPAVKGESAAAATVLGPAQLQFKVSMARAQQTGRAPDRVQCQGSLELRAGQRQECAVEEDGRWLLATVIAVDDRNIETTVGQTSIPAPGY